MVRVFVVDDEPSILLFFKKVLILNGFELVGIASNGMQAVDMFKSFTKKPDVILMDHRMPLKNGLEASSEILKLDPNVKIIFISADQTIKEETLTLGIADFLAKPFTIKDLIISIEKCVNKD